MTQRYEIRLERDTDGGVVMSRGRRGGAPGGGPRVFEEALADLKLTDAQAAAVASVREAFQEKGRALMQKTREGSSNPEGMRSARQEMMREMLEEMRGLLDAEQYGEFEKKIRSAPRRPPGR